MSRENKKSQEISEIKFSISSADEIVQKSVCLVYDQKSCGSGSVADPRMGSEEDKICVSCGLKTSDCVGHSGHIVLKIPVLHPMFITKIVSILKCVCINCFRLVLSFDHLFLENLVKANHMSIEGSSSGLLEKMVERLEKCDTCFHCGFLKPKIILQQKTSDIIMTLNNKKTILTDVEINKIFNNIPPDDVKLLGLSVHPKNLIITVLEVLPPRARPRIISGGVIHNDDLTLSYIEILKANRILGDEVSDEHKKEKAYQCLKFRLKTMMNNSQGKAKNPKLWDEKYLAKRI